MNLRPDPTRLDGDAATPAGIQPAGLLTRRRLIFAGLNLVTWLALLYACAVLLGHSGWSWLDALIFVALVFATPWTVLGFWNAAAGLWLLHGVRDPLALTSPYAAAGDDTSPLLVKVAVLMTVRNEDPARALARLSAVAESLDATGEGDAFSYFVLSDTSDAALGAREEEAVEEWRARSGMGQRIFYRRRTSNEGFKAGNLRDFGARWGGDYDLMLPLDADSVMAGETILRHVRMMQAHPRIGILQSLVVGMPSTSAFARIFQFGMRQGMRSYTMGQAWWTGDCGPFWGHNALVRIKPFMSECHLPVLPGEPPLGGPILSHDQVEATLMRRAGHEVRVLPQEGGSYEENPPTMLEFAQRDLRWCLGNLQYMKLLGTPGLKPVSRFQLVWAILMFFGLPAWTAVIALVPLKFLDGEDMAGFPVLLAIVTYVLFQIMFMSPKLAGLIDVLLTQGGTARYGGTMRFLAAAAVELVFSYIQSAISSLRTTIFMAGLPFGRTRLAWNGQARDAHALSWATAFAGLWPQLLFGLYLYGMLAWLSPVTLAWMTPVVMGYLLAIPFAVITAAPGLGRWMTRTRFCGLPEEFDTPPELAALGVGAPKRESGS
jgi:membrane glycosyltransferase